MTYSASYDISKYGNCSGWCLRVLKRVIMDSGGSRGKVEVEVGVVGSKLLAVLVYFH